MTSTPDERPPAPDRRDYLADAAAAVRATRHAVPMPVRQPGPGHIALVISTTPCPKHHAATGEPCWTLPSAERHGLTYPGVCSARVEAHIPRPRRKVQP